MGKNKAFRILIFLLAILAMVILFLRIAPMIVASASNVVFLLLLVVILLVVMYAFYRFARWAFKK